MGFQCYIELFVSTPTAQKGIQVITWMDVVTQGRLGSTTHYTLAAVHCGHAQYQLNRASGTVQPSDAV